MAQEVHVFSAGIGALTNDKFPITIVPSGWGGITVLGGFVVTRAAGTMNFNLIDMGTGGTVSSGTICTLGSTVFAADVPQALTVDTAFVDAGHYIGVEELNVGTFNAVTLVSFSYINGY